VTDPPYGMNLDAAYGNSTGNASKGIKKSSGYSPVIGDDEPFDPRPIMQLITCHEQFWFGADYYTDLIPDYKSGSWLVWDKRVGLEEVEYSASSFELCWSKQKHRRDIIRVRWFGAFGTETQDTKKRVHPTQKPVEVIVWIIENHCGQIIVDPFCGSGSTLIACEQTGRRGFGMEISPEYCAVILQRMSDTGQSPELER
jgi:site-specific DNA-methyltransferase (adenine-specific)